MTLAEKALDVALSYLGVKEDPPGSNRGPEVDDFIRAGGLDPTKGAYPWCACFVVACIKRAGLLLELTPTIRPSARVATLLQRNPDAMLDRAEVGSIFIHLQTNGDGHTGFVTAVNDDGSFDSVEGNSDAAGSRTGGSVVLQHRPSGYAQAFLAIRAAP
jgi:hypothetical protein